MVFSLLASFPKLTNLIFDQVFPDFLFKEPAASLADFTGQVDWIRK